MLSIIIPTLNAAGTLRATLKSCGKPGNGLQIVISDGGSTDNTLSIAEECSCRVVSGPAGRGQQLLRGAQAASLDWLLFLHADTCLPDNAATLMGDFAAGHENKDKAAVFSLKLDDSNPATRRIERLVGWRTRWLGLPYGDQGLFISRSFYDRLGGYRALDIMEDVDLVRRIGSDGIHVLDGAVTTSSIRYQQGGYWRRPLKNLSLLGLYKLGVSPTRLAKLY